MIFLDDFKESIRLLPTLDLIDKRAELDLAIARIQTQLETPNQSASIVDPDWERKARAALRFKTLEFEYVDSILSLRQNICNKFMKEAQRLLDSDTYNVILEAAS